jgi:hypothetical protein
MQGFRPYTNTKCTCCRAYPHVPASPSQSPSVRRTALVTARRTQGPRRSTCWTGICEVHSKHGTGGAINTECGRQQSLGGHDKQCKQRYTVHCLGDTKWAAWCTFRCEQAAKSIEPCSLGRTLSTHETDMPDTQRYRRTPRANNICTSSCADKASISLKVK